jgi:hypothetical protein
MVESVIKARIRKWGNTFGIRISRREMQRLRVREGAEVTARVTTHPEPADVSRFPVFHGPDPHGSRDHDRVIAESLAKRKQA